VEEEQDIVYVAMPDRFAPPPPQAPPADPAWSETVVADTVRLFRFSALTFNAHRIHFDLPYATGVERYPGLVVHGPLQAILLAEAAQRHAGGRRVATFRFRGVRPAFHFDPLTLCGTADGRLATVTPDGAVCMTAEIGWEAV
jgi:3-methylfumaryl-CoA hydratase